MIGVAIQFPARFSMKNEIESRYDKMLARLEESVRDKQISLRDGLANAFSLGCSYTNERDKERREAAAKIATTLPDR